MIFLRYIYIALFIIGIFMEHKAIDAAGIVLILIFIINNQLRYFILPKKKLYVVPSIIIEIIIAIFLYPLTDFLGSLIFAPALIDTIYYLDILYASVYAVAAAIFMSVQGRYNSLWIWIAAVMPILLLLLRVKDEETRKIVAQDLYDKLREKDEELKRVNKELEAYANTIEEIAVLRERNRISREIHDNVGHALSTIIIQLGAIEKISRVSGEEAGRMANNLEAFTKESMERVRTAVRAMKPREFEEYEGVIAISEMIKNFQKLTGIEVNLKVSDKVWKLNSDQTMAMYRIIQEFLSNSIRHGKATRVNIFINFLDTNLRVHLKDNGKGCSKVVSGVG
ncbi:MAG: sensor histidine kinase, partial [Bacillota bacterium]|nr:sensor histidine kinase [Bacillota bacterium]